MDDRPKNLALRIGRRGSCLLFFAMLDLCYALSLFRPSHDARLSPSLVFIQEIMPLSLWASLWAGVGLVCLAGAFARRDRWAFTCAVALKVLWGGTFLFGWMLVNLERGWLAAVIWLAMAGWVFIISSWPEAGRRLASEET